MTASLNAFNKDFVDVNTCTNDEKKSDPTFLTLLCCGCSTATIPVAEISHYWNVPHVSKSMIELHASIATSCLLLLLL